MPTKISPLSFSSFAIRQPLSSLTTIGIGGPAHFYQQVHTIEEMQKILRFCQMEKLPYMILGKGSNCLFDDRGFPGLIIHNRIQFHSSPAPGQFYVGAGYSFSLLGTQTARQGWGGLAFASGIPGSVGGAVFMNAGANGKETCDTLLSVDFVDEKGDRHTLPRKTLSFGYRSSPFQAMKGAIVGATFQLSSSATERQYQKEIIGYRTATQPYHSPSAGCIFRNPLPHHAGALIEKMGWKGKRWGGAQISEKHANFIVNMGNASSEDVHVLIRELQQQAKREYDIDLHVEIRCIPYREEV